MWLYEFVSLKRLWNQVIDLLKFSRTSEYGPTAVLGEVAVSYARGTPAR